MGDITQGQGVEYRLFKRFCLSNFKFGFVISLTAWPSLDVTPAAVGELRVLKRVLLLQAVTSTPLGPSTICVVCSRIKAGLIG